MAERLKSLWASILDRPETDIPDDAHFFEIGGDSVAAVKLAGLAGQEGLSLPAQTIFEKPHFGEMQEATRSNWKHEQSPSQRPTAAAASLIDSWEVISASLAQCNISNDDLADILPCTPFQQELIKASHQLGAWMFQAVFEVDPKSEERAKQTFSIVRDKNPAFRTRVVQHETGYYQLVTKDRIAWEQFEGKLDTFKNQQLAKRMW